MDKMIEIPEREYDRLKQFEDGDPKYCQGVSCIFQREYNNKRWSWSNFFIGIVRFVFSPELWVFAVITVLFVNFEDIKTLGHWIAYISIGGAFMFFKPLSNLLSKGKLNIEAKLGATATVNSDIKKSLKE
ncbi:MAG: hypothetical protein FWD78_02890 [Treponema sp.]|nr:hypothetical protein [Treponema sp.]